jgi:predicted metal-binding protein
MLDCDAAALCRKPYPGHPRGCPNLGRKDGCPPRAKHVTQLLDLSRPVWAIYNAFDLGWHVRRMRDVHPTWTERQLACCLYWQPAARRDLRREIRRELAILEPGVRVIGCPEACGVNVNATMETCGIYLDWPPRETAYQVVLAGAPVNPKPEAGR